MSTPSWGNWPQPGSSMESDTWVLRRQTLEAAAWLVLARLAVVWLPLPRWNARFGLEGAASAQAADAARKLARHVERAAMRLPFESKCLPRALALSLMLRRRTIAHRLALAVRPASGRTDRDALHAWLEVADEKVIGDLPGPWAVLHRIPPAAMPDCNRSKNPR